MSRDVVFAWAELAAIGVIAVVGFPISPLIGLLVLASVSLFARKKGWSDVGLRGGDGAGLVLAAGAILGAAALLATAWLWSPVLANLTGRAVELNHLPPVRGNAGLLATALVLAVAGAFAIEMVFRGYLFERIRQLAGNDPFAIVASAAVYAAVVSDHGLAATVGALAMGIGYGYMYLAGGRSLIMPIAFHCTFDATNLVLIYLKAVN